MKIIRISECHCHFVRLLLGHISIYYVGIAISVINNALEAVGTELGVQPGPHKMPKRRRKAMQSKAKKGRKRKAHSSAAKEADIPAPPAEELAVASTSMPSPIPSPAGQIANELPAPTDLT